MKRSFQAFVHSLAVNTLADALLQTKWWSTVDEQVIKIFAQCYAIM